VVVVIVQGDARGRREER